MPSFLLPIANWFKDVIQAVGYPGIFLAMLVEGIVTPIPSEVIMPFAGYLASQGQFNIALVILVGSLGAVIGSTGAYYIGYSLGRPFIRRYGKYFRLKEEHIVKAEDWFERYGDAAIFIGHALPGTRSFISFPAGIGKMKLRNFMIFTFSGAMIWNTVLALLGYFLGEAVFDLAETFEYFDIAVLLGLLLVLVIYLLWRRKKNQEA
jgi:membrane protein DedA with SNARE-associated domain